MADILTVKGGTGAIIEYYGPGVDTLSATGMATICNMGAEVGATTSLFPFTKATGDFLRATGRSQQAALAEHAADELLRPDQGAVYDRHISIDLSSLEPHLNGPFTPDLATPVSQMAGAVEANKWPKKLTAGLIGSCTNSSYEDMSRAADLARQAAAAGLKSKATIGVSPGSEQIRATIKRDGQMGDLESIGASLLTNSCGPCIGPSPPFCAPRVCSY